HGARWSLSANTAWVLAERWDLQTSVVVQRRAVTSDLWDITSSRRVAHELVAWSGALEAALTFHVGPWALLGQTALAGLTQAKDDVTVSPSRAFTLGLSPSFLSTGGTRLALSALGRWTFRGSSSIGTDASSTSEYDATLCAEHVW